MKDKTISIRTICITAIMTAIICIMTAVPKIPIPLGYAHLGDAFIVLTVLFVGKKEGILAAGIGSAMADLLGGFPVWVIPTLIIKCIMAWILGRIAYGKNDELHFFSFSTAIGVLASMVWMVAGYTIAGAILYGGIAVGLTSTPGLAVKAGMNMIIAYVVGSLFEKAHTRQLFLRLKNTNYEVRG